MTCAAGAVVKTTTSSIARTPRSGLADTVGPGLPLTYAVEPDPAMLTELRPRPFLNPAGTERDVQPVRKPTVWRADRLFALAPTCPIVDLAAQNSQFGKVTPHGAPGIYCCFDEQDLRAPFTVTIRAPGGWSCLANGPVVSQPPKGGPGIWRFAPTFPLPPWLSSFCAGPYAGPAFLCEHARDHLLPVTVQGGPAVATVVEAEQVLDLLRQVLPYYERKLGVPYPYEKLDLLFVSGLSSLPILNG
jgi:aminopeptidase N